MMQANSLVQDRILSSRNIVDYLVAKGHQPKPGPRGQTVFLCPLHNEDTPSFHVYPPDGEKNYYQSFYCYGCQSGGSLITLKMKLEGIGAKEAVGKLSDGLGIDKADEIDYLLERAAQHKEEPSGDTIDEAIFFASRTVYIHLRAVNFDHEQLQACDRMLQRIDLYAERNDRDRVLELTEALKDVLDVKIKEYFASKEKEDDDVRNVYSAM